MRRVSLGLVSEAEDGSVQGSMWHFNPADYGRLEELLREAFGPPLTDATATASAVDAAAAAGKGGVVLVQHPRGGDR